VAWHEQYAGHGQIFLVTKGFSTEGEDTIEKFFLIPYKGKSDVTFLVYYADCSALTYCHHVLQIKQLPVIFDLDLTLIQAETLQTLNKTYEKLDEKLGRNLSSDDRKQSLQERKNVLKWMGLLQDGRPTYGNDEEGRTQYQIFLGPRSNTWYLLHWRPKLKDFLQKLKEKSSSKFPRFCCAIATNGEARYAEDIVEQISGEHSMADSELFEVTKSFCPPEGWSRHKEEQNRQIDEHPKDCKQVWGFPVEMVAILDDQSETILHHGKEQKTWKEGQRENVVGVFPYKYNYLEGAEDRDLSLEPQRTQLQQMRLIYFREVHRMCLKFRQGDWFDLPESDDSRSIMHNPVTLPLPDIKSCIHEVSQRDV